MGGGRIISSLPSSHDSIFGFHAGKACGQCRAASYRDRGAARRLCGHGVGAGAGGNGQPGTRGGGSGGGSGVAGSSGRKRGVVKARVMQVYRRGSGERSRTQYYIGQ